MRARVLTAAAGIPLIMVMAYLGGAFWLAGVALLALLASQELGKMLAAKDVAWDRWLALGSVLALVLIRPQGNEKLVLVMAGACLFSLVYFVARYPRIPLPAIFTSLFASLYLGLMFGFLVALRGEGRGFVFLLLAFACTWANDTGAYLIGRSRGRRRLAPLVSPGKTWEGAIGGLILSALAGLIWALVTGRPGLAPAALGLLAGLMAQAGDLVESAIKRWAGVKDSGTILPGHGGILDRFDSLLFVAPVVYYLSPWL